MYNIIKHKVKDIEFDEISVFKGNLKVSILNYGATIKSIIFDDSEMVLSYKNIEDYVADGMYLGKTVGRFAGRIAKGEYTIKGTQYKTTINDLNRTLHGGCNTISDEVLHYSIEENDDLVTIIFEYIEEENNGFNGTVNLLIKYQIDTKNNILVEYKYKNSSYSILNYTNHSYFNLGKNDNISDLNISLNAQYAYKQNNLIIEKGKEVLIPQFDNKKVRNLLEYYGGNLDNTFILNDSNALQLVNKDKKISLAITTSYPCCVLYGCTYPNGKYLSNNQVMGKFAGLTCECQYAPNEINFAKDKAGCIVEPDKWYTNYIQYKFESYKNREGVLCNNILLN